MIAPASAELIPKGVIIAFKQKVVILLVRTVPSHIEQVVRFESADRLAVRSTVFLDILLDVCGLCLGVGSDLVKSAVLVGGAM
jgi:hypothetical protein